MSWTVRIRELCVEVLRRAEIARRVRVLMTESLVALSLEELPSCSLNRNWCRYDPCIIVLVDRGRLIRVHKCIRTSRQAWGPLSAGCSDMYCKSEKQKRELKMSVTVHFSGLVHLPTSKATLEFWYLWCIWANYSTISLTWWDKT